MRDMMMLFRIEANQSSAKTKLICVSKKNDFRIFQCAVRMNSSVSMNYDINFVKKFISCSTKILFLVLLLLDDVVCIFDNHIKQIFASFPIAFWWFHFITKKTTLKRAFNWLNHFLSSTIDGSINVYRFVDMKQL